MRKHIIIIASIYLFLGISIGVLFIYGHIQFFSLSSSLFPETSVADQDHSLFQRAGDFYQVYRNFFKQFGINPLFSSLTIISSLAFGYGLLKSKEWARKLGFVIIAVNVYSTVYAIFNRNISVIIIIQLGLTCYMWRVLCRKNLYIS